MTLLQPLSLVIGLVMVAGLVVAAWQSRREGDPKAAERLLLAVLVLPTPWLVAGLVTAEWAPWTVLFMLTFSFLALFVLLLPLGNPQSSQVQYGPTQLDERDTMFSRAELETDSDRYRAHYHRRPEHQLIDDQWRAKPGLLSPDSHYFDPLQFSASEASFQTVGALHGLVDGESADEQVKVDPVAAVHFLKGWAHKLGAVDVGITALKPEHCYSVGGRGDRYDQPVACDHPWALALTVEMDKDALDVGPAGPVVMESAQQYLNSGAIAVQLAVAIRHLGWKARAHIDGNYQLCCPLVARDAGLGEIGRMGLLMTPRLGPRVRIAVVTCDLPLVADVRRPDDTIHDFCLLCEKCADVCPGDAILRGRPGTVDGVERWQIDQAACFSVWCDTGTDCGRCMRSCPYSHPDTWLHRPIRWAIGRSHLARRVALVADDLIYGRRPPARTVSGWWIGQNN